MEATPMALELNSVKFTPSDEGEWKDSPDWAGVKFLVRSIESKDYRIARDLHFQKVMKALNRVPTTAELEPGVNKLLARHILRGWEGLAADGKPLEYSPQTAIEKMTDPELKALPEQVVACAARVGERDAEFTVDAAKNSSALSAST